VHYCKSALRVHWPFVVVRSNTQHVSLINFQLTHVITLHKQQQKNECTVDQELTDNAA